jgi:hypothetical protein
MFNTFIKSINRHYKWLSGTTSIIALFAIDANAEDKTDNDIKLWLKESAPEVSTQLNNPYYSSSNPVLVSDNEDDNIYQAQSFTHTKVKAKDKNMLRKLKDRLKLNLFYKSDKYSKNRIYISALKKELVNKAQYGQLKYELRFSEERAEATLRYSF